MNTNKKGFTLIELLVVIVIIGILATISVATFSGYFKKARDSERLAVVSNVATILKTAYATGDLTSYTMANEAALDTALNTYGGYAIPGDSWTEGDYYYAGEDAEFVIFNCSEEDDPGSIYAAGTVQGKSEAEAAKATICADTKAYATKLDLDDDGTDDDTPFVVTN